MKDTTTINVTTRPLSYWAELLNIKYNTLVVYSEKHTQKQTNQYIEQLLTRQIIQQLNRLNKFITNFDTMPDKDIAQQVKYEYVQKASQEIIKYFIQNT